MVIITIMSWDILLSKNENCDEPVGTYQEVVSWIQAHWEVEEWCDCVNNPAFIHGDGYSAEVTLGCESTRIRDKWFTENMPTDPMEIIQVFESAPQPAPKEDEPVDHIWMAIRGGGNPATELNQFCETHGLTMFDPQAGDEAEVEELEKSFEDWTEFLDSVR